MQMIDNFIFNHRENTVNAVLRVSWFNGEEKSRIVAFDYKGMRVNVDIPEDKSYITVAQNECRIIDKLGDEYKTFCLYRTFLKTIQKNHIVINGEIYNYYENNIDTSHLMLVTMEDGTVFDGNFSNDVFNPVRKNKRKSLENLQYSVKRYYKEKGIKPDKTLLNKELTREYKEKHDWIVERLYKVEK